MKPLVNDDRLFWDPENNQRSRLKILARTLWVVVRTMKRTMYISEICTVYYVK